MNEIKTSEQALEYAIQREDESLVFYLEWARKATNPMVNKVFLQLSEQELEHKEKLEAIRKGGRIFRFKDRLFPKMHLIDFVKETQLGPDATLNEALAIAMKREKAAYRMYLELAANSELESLVDVFLSLAHEEANHRVRLEVEYDKLIAAL